MKKFFCILGIIIILIIAVIIGKKLYESESSKNTKKEVEEIKNDIVVNQTDYSVRNDITVQTDIKEEKISPNARFVFQKKYTECGHTIKEYKQVEDSCVNMTKEELEEKYKGWNIEKFTSSEVILLKEVSGTCGEHYILKEKDGVIAIYKIENEKEVLEETTGVSVEYLTQEDKEKIKNGIKVNSKEELNSTLEDYE